MSVDDQANGKGTHAHENRHPHCANPACGIVLNIKAQRAKFDKYKACWSLKFSGKPTGIYLCHGSRHNCFMELYNCWRDHQVRVSNMYQNLSMASIARSSSQLSIVIVAERRWALVRW